MTIHQIVAVDHAGSILAMWETEDARTAWRVWSGAARTFRSYGKLMSTLSGLRVIPVATEGLEWTATPPDTSLTAYRSGNVHCIMGIIGKRPRV